MSSAWPPPPDLDSIKELVAAADVEGFLAEGSPADEYDTEAEALFSRIAHLPTADLVVPGLIPLLQDIWRSSFSLSPGELATRQPAFLQLAEQIARFFGPEAQPTVRSLM